MPPQPLEYEGHDAIAAFLRHRAELRGAPLRVVPTRANSQPAFGCYLPDAHAAIARPYGLIVSHDYGVFYNGIGSWLLARRFGVPFVSELHHIEGYPRAVGARVAARCRHAGSTYRRRMADSGRSASQP